MVLVFNKLLQCISQLQDLMVVFVFNKLSQKIEQNLKNIAVLLEVQFRNTLGCFEMGKSLKTLFGLKIYWRNKEISL